MPENAFKGTGSPQCKNSGRPPACLDRMLGLGLTKPSGLWRPSPALCPSCITLQNAAGLSQALPGPLPHASVSRAKQGLTPFYQAKPTKPSLHTAEQASLAAGLLPERDQWGSIVRELVFPGAEAVQMCCEQLLLHSPPPANYSAGVSSSVWSCAAVNARNHVH